MRIIGVTGGIGSGKSTVCKLLAQAGAVVIDADDVARQLTAAGGLAMSRIEAEFGRGFIAEDGSMNRVLMRKLLFSDASVKKRLEAILHPLISSITAQREMDARAKQAQLIAHDVPLLVESFGAWRERLDEVWVVDCSEETQIQRVMSRSGLTRAEVHSIMANQATREQRLECADLIIQNENKTLNELAELLQRELIRFGL